MLKAYIEKPAGPSLQLTNALGADVEKEELVVLAGKLVQAAQDVANGAVGGFDDCLGAKLAVDTFVSGEDAFAAAELDVFFDPVTRKASNTSTVGYYKIGVTLGAKSGGVVKFIGIDPRKIVEDSATMASAIDAAESDIDDLEASNVLASGTPFVRTATLTALAAGTAVHALAAADVGAGFKAVVTGFKATVSGATAWSGGTGTKVVIQDTNGTPVAGAEIAVAGLTGNAVIAEGHANVTLKAALASGFTAAKGIDIKADNNFGAGSDLVVTITGFIVAAA